MSIPTTFNAFIFYFIKKQWLGFWGILITTLAWSLNEALFPYFIKIIINSISSLNNLNVNIFSYLFWPLAGLALTWLIMEIALRLQGLIIVSTFPRFRATIRQHIFDYVIDHSHEYFTTHFSGSIANKIIDISKSCERIVEIVILYLIGILVAFSISIFLVGQVSLFFAFLLIIWFLLHFSVSAYFINIINQTTESHSEAVSLLSGRLIDCLSNILTVRLFAHGRFERDYFDKFQKQEIIKARIALWKMQIVQLLQGVLSLILMIAVMYTLIYGWKEGWVTLGDFSLISMSTFSMMGLIWFMDSQMVLVFREIGIVIAGLSLISEPQGVVDRPDAKPLKVTKAEIHFEKVNFSYKHNNIFKDTTLTIEAGQKVGLVGFSGSGKTTFVNLILRFYDILGGRILIDGQNIAEVTQDSLHEQIAMIPQDPSLFHRTLLENLRYGRLGASDEEVIEASKRAYCHDFIMKLKEGYQTVVGERGSKLSGGQRQRIAIARAMLKNAPILILDEATSALDSVTEKLIQESLRELMQKSTTIVIAHRLSTIADMDRILVFDKGKIVEDGTIDKLLKKESHFAQMWQMQHDGFLPEKAQEI